MAGRQTNQSLTTTQILRLAAEEALSAHKDDLVMGRIIADGFEGIIKRRYDHMEFGYLAPAEPFKNKHGAVIDQRVYEEYLYLKSLDEVMKVGGEFPLTCIDPETGDECLISAQQMYLDTLARPEYYVRRAVHELIADNIEVFKCIDKKNFFVPFCGTGEEVIQLLNILKEQHGIVPKLVIPSDINQHSVAITERGIRGLGIEASGVSGNIFGAKFFKHKIFKQSKVDDTVILIDPTYHNLRNKQQLLKNIYAAFKGGTLLIALLDATSNFDKIAAAYNSPLSGRWILRSYLWLRRKMGFNLGIDPKMITITAGVEPKLNRQTGAVDINLSVTHHGKKTYPIIVKGQEYEITFPEVLSAGTSSKMTEEAIVRDFRSAGLSMRNREPFMQRKQAAEDGIKFVGLVCGIVGRKPMSYIL